MNRYIIIVTLISAITLPLGVYIGYQMALENWWIVIGGTAILIAGETLFCLLWVKGQSLDIQERLSDVPDPSLKKKTKPKESIEKNPKDSSDIGESQSDSSNKGKWDIGEITEKETKHLYAKFLDGNPSSALCRTPEEGVITKDENEVNCLVCMGIIERGNEIKKLLDKPKESKGKEE